LTWNATNTAGSFLVNGAGAVRIVSSNTASSEIGMTNGSTTVKGATMLALATPLTEGWAVGHSNRPPVGMVPTLVNETTGSVEYKTEVYRASTGRVSAGVHEAAVSDTYPQLRGSTVPNATMAIVTMYSGAGVFNDGNDTLKLGNMAAKAIRSQQLVAIGVGEIKYGSTCIFTYSTNYDSWIYHSQSAQADFYAQNGTFSGYRQVVNPVGLQITGTGALDFRGGGSVYIECTDPGSGFLYMDNNITQLYGLVPSLVGSSQVILTAPDVTVSTTTALKLGTPRRTAALSRAGEALTQDSSGNVEFEALGYRGDAFDTTTNVFRLPTTGHIGGLVCTPSYTGSTQPAQGVVVVAKFIRSADNSVTTPTIQANPTFALGNSGLDTPIYYNDGTQPATGAMKVNGTYMLTYTPLPTPRWIILGQ
jgi:hypothetical protein